MPSIPPAPNTNPVVSTPTSIEASLNSVIFVTYRQTSASFCEIQDQNYLYFTKTGSRP